jgi:putative ABC transport system permease protein
MIVSYLKTALRNIRRHKGYAFLNIAGLVIGLTAATLILVYVKFEWSFDRFHSKADRIYRVYKRDPGNVFIGSDYFAVTPEPLAGALKKDFPFVEQSVTIKPGGGLVRAGQDAYLESDMYFAGPSVFAIFDFPLVEGNPETALSEPFAAVLSEELARKYFGTPDAVGRTIRLWDTLLVRITGVMKDVPENSHLRPKLLGPTKPPWLTKPSFNGTTARTIRTSFSSEVRIPRSSNRNFPPLRKSTLENRKAKRSTGDKHSSFSNP